MSNVLTIWHILNCTEILIFLINMMLTPSSYLHSAFNSISWSPSLLAFSACVPIEERSRSILSTSAIIWFTSWASYNTGLAVCNFNNKFVQIVHIRYLTKCCNLYIYRLNADQGSIHVFVFTILRAKTVPGCSTFMLLQAVSSTVAKRIDPLQCCSATLNPSHCKMNKQYASMTILVNSLKYAAITIITWARCKKDVWRFSDEANLRATGNFWSDNLSGRLSNAEAIQFSQWRAKLRISQSKLKK